MTFKKRGLGRGLDALLADDSAKAEKYQPHTLQSGDYPAVKDAEHDDIQPIPAVIDNGKGAGTQIEQVDGRTAVVLGLFKSIQREHLNLLEEAEALRKLIEEFESVVRADLS
jgi:ParB family chromosome partitioning protein